MHVPTIFFEVGRINTFGVRQVYSLTDLLAESQSRCRESGGSRCTPRMLHTPRRMSDGMVGAGVVDGGLQCITGVQHGREVPHKAAVKLKEAVVLQ